jgi:hypothetical protein
MQVVAFDRSDACGRGAASGSSATLQRSATARGRIAWREVAAQGQPCSVDIDLDVTFAATGAIPASDRLFAEGLRLDCN